MSFGCSATNKDELIHRLTRQGRVICLESHLNLIPKFDINRYFDYGRSRWTLLIAACFYRHENIVRMLLRRFKPDVNAVGDVKLDFVQEVMYGVSALWVAVAVGHFDIVKLLVEQGHANVNHLSVTRSSALRAASYIGRIDIAQYLIEHGADMKLVREGNYTNLMLSAYREHEDLVTYYLDVLQCDPNEHDQDGRTPLHYAIDGGSVRVIQILLERGAKNICSDAICPIFWAALEARSDLVDVFKDYCVSDDQWIEARELLGASYANAESKYYNLDKAIQHITLAYRWRIEKNRPKNVRAHPLIEAFDYAEECETLVEFQRTSSQSNHRLHIESLLIQRRILGSKNKRYRRAVRFYGALLADTHQYDEGLRLWLYELDLRRKYAIPLDRWHLRDFIHMFAEMIINDVQIISPQALFEVLVALDNELSHGRHPDHNLFTLFYLIVVISHNSDEQKLLPSMKKIYQTLGLMVRREYRTTRENCHNWTLLHLSMMAGLPVVNDRHLMNLCKYPCPKTVHLLLKCGADVDAMDDRRNTPLHLISRRNEEKQIENVIAIIDLLCDYGHAHPDCVNDQNETPIQAVLMPSVKSHLREKSQVTRLKCLCARLIQEQKLMVNESQFPLSLRDFIRIH